MTTIQDGLQLTATDTLESLWEQFERTGSVQAFLKYQQLAAQAEFTPEEN